MPSLNPGWSKNRSNRTNGPSPPGMGNLGFGKGGLLNSREAPAPPPVGFIGLGFGGGRKRWILLAAPGGGRLIPGAATGIKLVGKQQVRRR
ncbi:hypothetical protein HC931_26870 [Candidatus Gracilibacteria bacterium]|nr:hypothetical protein [Candidatus Gracilibacteria bacterium]